MRTIVLALLLTVACSPIPADIARAGTPCGGKIIFGDCQAGTTCVAFDWPDVPGAVRYLWEYRKDYESWPVGSDHQQYVTESEAFDCYSEEGGKSWRVTSYDASGEPIKQCREMQFFINHCVPEVIHPCNGVISRNDSPDTICVPFNWTAVQHGAGYYVWQYRDQEDPWGLPGTSVQLSDPEYRHCFSSLGSKFWRFWVYNLAGDPAYRSEVCYICLQCTSPTANHAWWSIKKLWR